MAEAVKHLETYLGDFAVFVYYDGVTVNECDPTTYTANYLVVVPQALDKAKSSMTDAPTAVMNMRCKRRRRRRLSDSDNHVDREADDNKGVGVTTVGTFIHEVSVRMRACGRCTQP
jgi:hypothetical protein